MRRILSWCLAAVLCAGCGYTTGNLLPSNFRTISIEPFKNKVSYLSENARGLYIPLLEVRAHDAIVDGFQRDGHLKIANSGMGDLILKGDLISFDREEVGVDDNDNVTEYRVRITVSLMLEDPAMPEQPMWVESAFSGEATYHLTGPNAKSEAEALEDALTDLSRRVIERTLENW
jgi:hypothetical protein